MKFYFHPDAETELTDAIAYYDGCETGLGYDFAIEIYSAIERIIAHPRAWQILEGDIRRCLVRRFPYGILYAEESSRIEIVAIMNLHREPDYWKGRRQ